MSYQLHYAALQLNGNITCFEFDSKYKLLNFIELNYYKHRITYLNKICLVAISDNLIVVNSMHRILEFVDNELLSLDFDANVFLQEYETWEDAYKVAISMKEDESFNKLF
jgi:hypothetical protein